MIKSSMPRLPRLLPVATSRNARIARGSAMSERAVAEDSRNARSLGNRFATSANRDTTSGEGGGSGLTPNGEGACGACSFPECSGSGSRENAHSDLCLCHSASRSRSRAMSRSAIAVSSSTAVRGGLGTATRVSRPSADDSSPERKPGRAPESPPISTSTSAASSMTPAVRFSVPETRFLCVAPARPTWPSPRPTAVISATAREPKPSREAPECELPDARRAVASRRGASRVNDPERAKSPSAFAANWQRSSVRHRRLRDRAPSIARDSPSRTPKPTRETHHLRALVSGASPLPSSPARDA